MEVIDSPLGIKLARYRGEIPTPRELKALARRGIGLSVSLHSKVRDLQWLEPVAHRLSHLLVTSGHALDADTLSEMTALRFLSLNAEPDRDVNLSTLPALTEVRAWEGGAGRILSVLESRSLLRAELNGLRLHTIPLISAPLRWLDLGDCRSLRSIPLVKNPGTLTRLDLEGVRRLDCTQVSSLTSLERLSFTSCRELENVASLLDLPNLQQLTFRNCPVIDDVRSLLSLSGVNVGVDGTNAFFQKFRVAAHMRRLSTWTFPLNSPPAALSLSASDEL